MNYTAISSRIVCNRCNHVQSQDAKHCSACGISFIYGEPDAWKAPSFTSSSTLIDVDDATDREIDKHFSKTRKPRKSSKLAPVEEKEYEGLFKECSTNPWSLMVIVFMTAIVIHAVIRTLTKG